MKAVQTKAQLLAENRKLKKLLREAVKDRESELDFLSTQEKKDFLQATPEYILAIETIQRYGYGATMKAVALAWSNLLSKNGNYDGGIFVPSICKGSIESWIVRVKKVIKI